MEKRNNLRGKGHPFNKFNGFDAISFSHGQEDHMEDYTSKYDLRQSLEKWDTVLLLAELLTEIVSRKTGLDEHSELISYRREKLYSILNQKQLDFFLNSMFTPDTTLTKEDDNNCIDVAKRIRYLTLSGLNLRATIVHILDGNFKMERKVFVLKQQLKSLQKLHPFDNKDLQQLVMPGKMIQNDLRVNWPYLRDIHGVILDEPAGHYHYGINKILETPVTINENEKFQVKDILSSTREAFKISNNLGASAMMQIDKQLHRQGLCYKLTVEKLLARFYYCYFATIPLSAIQISTRIRNALRTKHIYTIGDLLLQTEKSFSLIAYMGGKSIIDLRDLLGAMGLGFNMKEADFKKLYSV